MVTHPQNSPGDPREGQGEASPDQDEAASPTERRYRERRDLRLDSLLRRVHRHGIESLSEVELNFLERSAAELRCELGWEGSTPGWDPPSDDSTFL